MSLNNRVAVSSIEYWNTRFSTLEWDQAKEKTLFFGNLALEHMPSWFVDYVGNSKLSICDFGCVLGQATQLLALHFPNSEVIGQDISNAEIIAAKKLFPKVKFTSRLRFSEKYDIIFSSNTLEHFYNPEDIIDELSVHARKFLVFLLPFYDGLTINEHFYKFTYDNIPIIIKNKFELVFYKRIDASRIPNTQWYDHHVLIIYANQAVISELESNNNNISTFKKTKESYRLAMWEACLKKDAEKKSSEYFFFSTQQILAQEQIDHQTSKRELEQEKLLLAQEQADHQLSKHKFLQAKLLNDYVLSSFSWKKTASIRKAFRIYVQAKNISKRIYKIYKTFGILNIFSKLKYHVKQYGVFSTIEYFKSKLFSRINCKLAFKQISAPLLTDKQILKIKYTLQRKEKNKKCIIFQLAFLDFNGAKYLAGGAERYCIELSNILKNNNYEIILVQMGNSDFWATEYDGLSIFGIPVQTNADKFYKAIEELECFADVCIYSPFSLVPLNSKSISIGIIHSMFWDDPARLYFSNIDLYSEKLKACYSVVSNSAVAINWFRGYKGVGYHNFHYIPNFVCLKSFKPIKKSTNESDIIHILFPRRVTADRGFQYILDVFPKLFKKYQNIFLIIAGYVHNDQKNQLQRFLNEFKGKVSHTEAQPPEMLSLYQKADIVLIPTPYTEGTSLSCLEAMACGKAIITTNVGGLPELIINRYNGLTIDPCKKELYATISSLIENPQLRLELGRHAHQVVQAFSIDIWKDKWIKLLKSIPHNPVQIISNKEQIPFNCGDITIIFEKFMPWNFEYIQRFHHIPRALSKLGLSCIFHGFEHHDKLSTKEIRKLQDNFYLTADKNIIERVRGRSKTVNYFNCYAKEVLHIEYLENLIQNGHLVIYDYCDHIHEDIFLTEIPENVLESQEYCFKNSSILILASAKSLYEHAIQIRGSATNIFLVPNAANKDNFQSNAAVKIPKSLKQSINNKQKIIGYFGAVANWFDYELVLKLSQLFPEYTICIIGLFNNQLFNQYGLNKQSNIITEPPIKHEALFDYAKWFDVSIIPFIDNEIIKGCSPVKLFEYMNIGVPIVTTDIPECRQYKSIFIGKNHEEFIALITKVLNIAKDDEYFQVMKKEAKENTWEHRAKIIIAAIYESLDTH